MVAAMPLGAGGAGAGMVDVGVFEEPSSPISDSKN